MADRHWESLVARFEQQDRILSLGSRGQLSWDATGMRYCVGFEGNLVGHYFGPRPQAAESVGGLSLGHERVRVLHHLIKREFFAGLSELGAWFILIGALAVFEIVTWRVGLAGTALVGGVTGANKMFRFSQAFWPAAPGSRGAALAAATQVAFLAAGAFLGSEVLLLITLIEQR